MEGTEEKEETTERWKEGEGREGGRKTELRTSGGCEWGEMKVTKGCVRGNSERK